LCAQWWRHLTDNSGVILTYELVPKKKRRLTGQLRGRMRRKQRSHSCHLARRPESWKSGNTPMRWAGHRWPWEAVFDSLSKDSGWSWTLQTALAMSIMNEWGKARLADVASRSDSNKHFGSLKMLWHEPWRELKMRPRVSPSVQEQAAWSPQEILPIQLSIHMPVSRIYFW